MIFFTKLEPIILQCAWKHKTPQIAKAILRKEIGAGEINLPDIRLYYKVTVFKTVWYRHKKKKYRPMEQDRNPGEKSVHLWGPYL